MPSFLVAGSRIDIALDVADTFYFELDYFIKSLALELPVKAPFNVISEKDGAGHLSVKSTFEIVGP